MRYLLLSIVLSLTVNASAADYEHIVLKKIVHPYLEVVIEYPYFHGAPRLNALIGERVFGDGAWPTNHEQIPPDLRKFPWELTEEDYCNEEMASTKGPNQFCEIHRLSYTIAYLDDNYVSMSMNKSSFLGETHGLIDTYSVNYDLNRERSLTLDDIFSSKSDYLARLSDIVNQELPENSCGRRIDPNGTDFNVWRINKGGISLYWGPDYLCTNMGSFSITIPFFELRDILVNPAFPARK